MAGITPLQEIYKKKGKEFVSKLFDSYVTVNEKLDACLRGDTMILTEDGQKTIKEIVDNNYTGKIVSVDIDTGEAILDEIVHLSSSDGSDAQWYIIEMEDNSSLYVTGNHKIWIPSLNCWRRVDDLDGSESFLMKK